MLQVSTEETMIHKGISASDEHRIDDETQGDRSTGENRRDNDTQGDKCYR